MAFVNVALDLPPMAKIDDVATAAAGIGADVGGGARVGAMIGEQPNGFERGSAVRDERQCRRRCVVGLHNLRYDNAG